ncbi:hypothetical protein DACRYDRAFT_23736 [Dacryopinax primogenitus]|uniref:Uncharacterized protein n=1 Tax=Dacryopinax primogenitus (strain DJM 731) TaxID=1858805 RepID=M5G1I1_DACPD|nr:uncharacterized protein DACRYDRAFT_23736 [Dacryopinax primogenitus]EJT99681.1 hypothetical protein DACRYDRAFT_23736 [Dacryopinax primogenitus]
MMRLPRVSNAGIRSAAIISREDVYLDQIPIHARPTYVDILIEDALLMISASSLDIGLYFCLVRTKRAAFLFLAGSRRQVIASITYPSARRLLLVCCRQPHTETAILPNPTTTLLGARCLPQSFPGSIH